MTDTTAAELEAERLGRDHGTAHGTWVVDGNTSEGMLRTLIKASEDGEFYATICGDVSSPLSYEFADGYSMARLSIELGVDEDADTFPDLADIFEDAYFTALEDEAVRSAKASLPEDEEE